MRTYTDPVKITTLHGPLYIAVTPGEMRSWSDTERGKITEHRPELRIASDPEFTGDANAAEHWVIRRRNYGVHYVVYNDGIWRPDGITQNRGLRNDVGGTVDDSTKTHEVVWQELTRALDTFDVQYPSWRELSHYLHTTVEHSSLTGKAADLRAEAKAVDAKAKEYARMIVDIAVTMGEDAFQILKES